ncbi:MAG TPA: NAD-dependent DNA ligase LigA [Kofleriaceae bacterium]|nr:NAD-dependent DNA ligase LigA [Kofleriaceae bacterium]
MKNAKTRIAELAKLLRKYKDAYYNHTPLVSDAAYDALEDELRTLDPDHPILNSVGAPAAAVTAWEKARHAIPMGSLNKVVSEDEFRAWAKRCDELGAKDKLRSIAGELFVTEKLDGLSLAVTYDKGVLADAITRGDGLVGERITPNARRMKGVPGKLKHAVSVTVRGEIILRLSDMKKAFPDAANPRNQASGTSKRFDGEGCEHLSVMFYDLDGEDHATEHEKFARLAALGLTVPTHDTADLDGAIAIHRDYAKTRRAKLDYEIDGLVIRANDSHAQHMLGELGNRPRGAIAFKFASQAKVTKLVDIVWETGSSGRVSPVAVVEPVELAGATVRRASLHNAGNVAELGIGIGDEVLVSRRNDVIPYIEEVVTKHGKPAKPPTRCATCKAPLEKIGEYLACRNRSCRALIEGRIQNWIDAIGVLEWGDKLIAQLVEAELVEEPADLYKLAAKDIAALERRGMVIGQKVIDNLRAQLPLSLPKFLAALGIESFGLQTAKAIVAAGYDSLAKVQAAKLDELAALPGVGPAKAKAAFDGLKARKAEIARLVAAGVEPVTRAAAGPLAGKTFCFTGALGRPRKELEQMVEQAGGTILNGVTKDLHYLVMADPQSGSSKAEKAKKYGTECIDEAGFLAMFRTKPAAKKTSSSPARA